MGKTKITNTKEQIKNPTHAALTLLDMSMGHNTIERQEEIGQSQLASSGQIPTRFSRGKKEDLEALGVKFLGVCKDDPIFQNVELPQGWTVLKDGNAYWSYLVNEKDEQVASMFYKAAFYDRHSHISISSEYII